MKTIYLLLIAFVAVGLTACTGLTPQENEEMLRLADGIRVLKEAIETNGLTPDIAGQLAAATTRLAELTAKANQSGGSIDWEYLGIAAGGLLAGVFGQRVWRRGHPQPATAQT